MLYLSFPLLCLIIKSNSHICIYTIESPWIYINMAWKWQAFRDARVQCYKKKIKLRRLKRTAHKLYINRILHPKIHFYWQKWRSWIFWIHTIIIFTASKAWKSSLISNYTHRHTHTDTHTYTHSHTHIYIYIYLFVCMSVYVQIGKTTMSSEEDFIYSKLVANAKCFSF